MEGTTIAPWPGGLGGMEVAICALIHFYVQGEPLNETGPLLTRLVGYTLRLILRIDPHPGNAQTFLHQLQMTLQQGNGTTEATEATATTTRSILRQITASIDEASTFAGLHSFFARMERLLLREEMVDEVDDETIKPPERQIDESSPFGYFLHRCLETYLTMDDEDFRRTVQRFSQWMSTERGDPASQPIQTSTEEDFVLALRQGEYAVARSLLEGSFDRPPAVMMGKSLHDTLLYHATFHLKTKGYQTARDALQEALRLARGENDVKAIAACDEMLRQIEYEEVKARPRSPIDALLEQVQNHGNTSSAMKHKRDAYRSLEEGDPLIGTLTSVEVLRSEARRKANVVTDSHSLDATKGEYDAILASTWDALGSKHNAVAMCLVAADGRASLQGWPEKEHGVALALSRARRLSIAGDWQAALAEIIGEDLLKTMDVEMIQQWHAESLSIIYRIAIRAASQAVMDSVERLRPEVIQECGMAGYDDGTGPDSVTDNEATFGRQARTTRQQEWLRTLNEAKERRLLAHDPAQALMMAIKVMHAAREARWLVLYRRATLEVADSLLDLGQLQRAQERLEEILPQALVDNDVEIQGRTCWTYGRILLAGQTEAACREALPWFQRAADIFDKASMAPELIQVHRVRQRILQHLGEPDQLVLEAHEAEKRAEESMMAMANFLSTALEKVQRIAASISARTVAGG